MAAAPGRTAAPSRATAARASRVRGSSPSKRVADTPGVYAPGTPGVKCSDAGFPTTHAELGRVGALTVTVGKWCSFWRLGAPPESPDRDEDGTSSHAGRSVPQRAAAPGPGPGEEEDDRVQGGLYRPDEDAERAPARREDNGGRPPIDPGDYAASDS